MTLREWYANREILLIGVTSELGRNLLEKLLRTFPDVKVNLIVRKRNNLTKDDRVKKIFESPGSSETSKYVTKSIKPIGSTVDSKKVKFFAKLNNKWWDRNGYLALLHIMNNIRVQFVQDGLAKAGFIKDDANLPLEGIKIVDIGCGGGILSEPLAKLGAEVTGIDNSLELINVAKEHASLDCNLSGRLNYIQTTIEEFEKENKEKYDAVVASEILEHVFNQQLFIKSCSSIIKPGGSLFVTTTNKTLQSWLAGIVAEYIFNILAIGTNEWNKFISPEEVQCFLETYGLKTKIIRGMIFNLIKYEWYWSSNVSMGYALHAIKQYERLREEDPDAISRVTVYEGNLIYDDLGITNEERERMKKKVSIVFHASGPHDAIFQFSEELPKLKTLAATSTVFKYKGKINECLQNEYIPNVPLALIRVALLGPPLQEPMQGHVEILKGTTALMIGAGYVLGNAQKSAELTPLDIATNTLIAAAWERAQRIVKEHERVRKALKSVESIAWRSWSAERNRIYVLHQRLSQNDQQTFPLIVDADIENYILSTAASTRKHCVDESTLSLLRNIRLFFIVVILTLLFSYIFIYVKFLLIN
ncbi:uncharacterized protein LOC124952192 isoform X3 [Vespa velutina]|uniref:uncharacterized protein LOC124952192 isoform X3 n=1 Tax=Vespa velutina TaxID=202808 RepID=UPI001FB3726E|nr:uncharacterized protein LOC124952192 isoform X3 [Vespa velutina]